MGDSITIPRTFAGQLGVADTLPSVRRHYIPIPLVGAMNNTTTGGMFGGDSNTTGIPFLQRNLTIERFLVSGFMFTTVNSSTTLLTIQMHKNGVSTIFNLTFRNSTTQVERWHADSTTPILPNANSTDRISCRIVTRNMMSRLSAVLVARERLD